MTLFLFLPLTVLALVAAPVLANVQNAKEVRFVDSRKIDYPSEINLGKGLGQPKEEWFRDNGSLQVRNVESATITPFLPKRTANTGAAVVIAPGGGFLRLAIEEEGYRIARWLSDYGIAAFVLKYRVLPTPADAATFRREIVAVRSGKTTSSLVPPADTPPMALADSKAAVRYVRTHAAQYGVDPDRIGMMGFSAGAFAIMSVVLTNDLDTRLAFAAPIYGRQDEVDAPVNPPPLFIAIAADVPLFWKSEAGLAGSWNKVGGKVEFHLYQTGGHGFGLGTAGTSTVDWIEGFRRWLDLNGLLSVRK